jgi:hypothetical protein
VSVEAVDYSQHCLYEALPVLITGEQLLLSMLTVFFGPKFYPALTHRGVGFAFKHLLCRELGPHVVFETYIAEAEGTRLLFKVAFVATNQGCAIRVLGPFCEA